MADEAVPDRGVFGSMVLTGVAEVIPSPRDEQEDGARADEENGADR